MSENIDVKPTETPQPESVPAEVTTSETPQPEPVPAEVTTSETPQPEPVPAEVTTPETPQPESVPAEVTTPETPQPESVPAEVTTPETASPKVVIENKNGYVGSIYCSECHDKEYQGWKNTLHSTMVQDTKKNPTAILGDFSDPRVKEFSDKYDVSNTVGSHWQQRYLSKKGNDWLVFPFTWSIVNRSWEMASRSKRKYWKRSHYSYSRKCIGCHTTNYDPKDKSFTEHMVGCEACHGPGYEHIMTDGDQGKIVNPSKLHDDFRDMICASCHVRAMDVSKTYTFPIGFKPGENLADYISVETLPTEGEDDTPEKIILREFSRWKKYRKSPKSCEVCGVEKPSDIPVHLYDLTAESEDFCLECHDFKTDLSRHTNHVEKISCKDCHKTIDEKEEDTNGRNIHSYGYYLIHQTGCYDPYIEKYCIKCHNDKTRDWATSYVIDWSIPPDFAGHAE